MKKILIVEDEPLLMMLAIDIVEDAGFDAVEANNADEAIVLLEADFDIKIMWTDIDMPGSMNGLELAEKVHDRWPPIGIIVVSGMRKPNPWEMPDGGVFYSKPYDKTKITDTLLRMAA